MAAQRTAERRREVLLTIPPEPHVRIADELDYPGATCLLGVNQYLQARFKPDQHSPGDKAKGVQRAQLFPQHNQAYHYKCGAVIWWDSNGFACYSCFRVLPMLKFSCRQTRKGNAKDSPSDQASCGILIRTMADRNNVYIKTTSGIDLRFYECPQCEEKTLGCECTSLPKYRRSCLFCTGDICHFCGCIVDEEDRWWCGRVCSKNAWEFV